MAKPRAKGVWVVLVLVGMAALVLGMSLGEPAPGVAPVRESAWLLVGPLVLGAAVLMLGVYLPGPLRDALAGAAVGLGGSVP